MIFLGSTIPSTNSTKSKAFNIIISPRAQKEIENAIDYYCLYSGNAPEKFVVALKEAYQTLQEIPY
ncbi:MAG: type II toxin-antitoxin system RelE/ParE family toxin [Flavobacteriales bacterium]|nr:type II toxin-antitoxin system RelE/ParE family toxin [Flavobacteriales bacterium]